MEIKTNNQPRKMLYGYQLTDEQKSDFDYVEDIDSSNFVKYKGVIYSMGDFMTTNGNDTFCGWDGYCYHTAFSGVLIRIVDSDTVIMGSYSC